MSRSLVTLAITIAALANAPDARAASNDDRSAAVEIEQLPFGDVRSTTEATTEDGETSCAPIGATVWYSLTPSTDVVIEVSTRGSDFDTVLAIYAGPTLVRCNDDFAGTTSQITVSLAAGRTAFVQAGGYDGVTGELHLAAQEASTGLTNDDFEDASVVGSLPFTAEQSTVGWTLQPHEPVVCTPRGGSVWFSYTADDTVPIGIGTFTDGWQDDPSTTVAVYTGSELHDLRPVACNGSSGTRAATVTGFIASAGTTYRIQVSGFAHGFPNLRVRISSGIGVGTDWPANAGVVADAEEVQAGAQSGTVTWAGADVAHTSDRTELTAANFSDAGLVVGRLITADGDVDVLVAVVSAEAIVVTAGAHTGSAYACVVAMDQRACV